jgi:hypothetical protein|tara:strand:+ start:25 stop:372 length:348 start_codon:yes stop_codon:yes gene_type:complete
MEYIYCKLDVDGETIIGAVVAQPLSTDEERKAALEKTTGWNKDLWIRNNCGQDGKIGEAGGKWDGTNFHPPQPYPSWVYNAGTNSWEAPTPPGNPDNLEPGYWNEEAGNWWDTHS